MCYPCYSSSWSCSHMHYFPFLMHSSTPKQQQQPKRIWMFNANTKTLVKNFSTGNLVGWRLNLLKKIVEMLIITIATNVKIIYKRIRLDSSKKCRIRIKCSTLFTMQMRCSYIHFHWEASIKINCIDIYDSIRLNSNNWQFTDKMLLISHISNFRHLSLLKLPIARPSMYSRSLEFYCIHLSKAWFEFE